MIIPLVEIAERYFGIEFDQRQVLTIADGRSYLHERSSKIKYDMIFIDAFQGTGRIPYELGTQEFYKTCKLHLATDGVVCVNIIDTDPLFKEKINTFRDAFKECYFFIHQGAYLMFGSNAGTLTQDERETRVETLYKEHKFMFPFVEHTKALFHINESTELQKKFGNIIKPLSDKNSPIDVLRDIPVTDPIFYNVGRNDLCPCGSGLKYKKCHGSTKIKALQEEKGLFK